MLLVNRYYLIALLFILFSCANDSVAHVHPAISNDIDHPRPSLTSTTVGLYLDSLNVGGLEIESDVEAKINNLVPIDAESNN